MATPVFTDAQAAEIQMIVATNVASRRKNEAVAESVRRYVLSQGIVATVTYTNGDLVIEAV